MHNFFRRFFDAIFCVYLCCGFAVGSLFRRAVIWAVPALHYGRLFGCAVAAGCGRAVASFQRRRKDRRAVITWADVRERELYDTPAACIRNAKRGAEADACTRKRNQS